MSLGSARRSAASVVSFPLSGIMSNNFMHRIGEDNESPITLQKSQRFNGKRKNARFLIVKLLQKSAR
jgi:hypothetical protein